MRNASLRRALELFDILQQEDYLSKPQLAKLLGVDKRTIKSYIDVLEEFGWPIERKNGKGFRLSPSGAATRFSEADLLLLAILLAQGASMLPALEFERLSKKLLGLLPENSLSKVQKLNNNVENIGARTSEIEVLTCIGRCLSDPHYQISADYQKNAEEQPQRRQLLPFKLRYQGNCCYVDCHDLEKSVDRSFRVDRFVSVSLLRQESPIPRPTTKIDSTHKWDFGDGPEIQVGLQISERLARWLMDKPEHPSQQLCRQDEDWQVTYTVRRLDFFVDWVLSLRGARPLAPASLIAAVQERCRSFLETGGTLEVEWG